MTSAPLSKAARPISPTSPQDDEKAFDQEILAATVALAGRLLSAAQGAQRRAEKREGAQMARMMDDGAGKGFLFAMVDETFRSAKHSVAARRWRSIVRDFGVPRYPAFHERAMMHLGAFASRFVPQIVMPLVQTMMRTQTARVILSGEEKALQKFLALRHKQGFSINLNHLGEAVLGDEEARHRLDAALKFLARPDVSYISIKISAIFSQINLLAWDETLDAIKERLRPLYRAALPGKKFVNLDMEEYRDLALTIAAFTQVLDEPEFKNLEAGIVLQAYLPDSFGAQQELVAWARERVARSGAGIKIRLVKGANLAMERVEAELHGWKAAPYASKPETDANFRRMLEWGCRSENASVARLGVASHNLFDVALALVLREKMGVAERVEIEMLEGMAPHQARAVRAEAGGLLLYAPVVKRTDFLSALAYLIRRLDENTSKDNFLRDAFGLTADGATWHEQRQAFETGWKARHQVFAGSRRALPPGETHNEPLESEAQSETQDGLELDLAAALQGGLETDAETDLLEADDAKTGAETAPRNGAQNQSPSDSPSAPSADTFDNEPDADWTQKAERDALNQALAAWQTPEMPALPALEEVLQTACRSQIGWENLGIAARAEMMNRAAQVMARGRFEAIACMREDAKKAVPEADAEVSEAIDFARYYALHSVPDEVGNGATDDAPNSARDSANSANFGIANDTAIGISGGAGRSGAENGWANGAGSGIAARALGVVVVTPPWNFPYAIPCGGAVAALMAGNAVILKPAPETAQTAYLLARQLWEAGVPRDVLQFFPCDDGETGQALICDERVNAVILTGSLETARMFQGWRPSLHLLAETSGKNALVITAQADREAAIKDLVKSALGHAGQKCSAASLGIIEAEVYDSPDFRRQLRDCAQSLWVGPSSDARSVVTPTVQAPGESLRRALTTLDAGESWLLEPKQIGDDPCAWSPGIKLGVKNGAWFHGTECFGPVLGLMRADSLAHALELQNATRFGLTAGLHSLDPQEIAQWSEKVEAGNLYINRGTTGAVVQRQPFGGWKASSLGAGAKAGGPHYVWSLMRFSDADGAAADGISGNGVSSNTASGGPDLENGISGGATDFGASYRAAWRDYFSRAHDPSELKSESNVLRFRACRGVILRLPTRAETLGARAQLAAQLTGAALLISAADEESDAAFAARLPQLFARYDRLRTVGGTVAGAGDEVLRAAHGAGFNWIDAPILSNGRLELRLWLREQAIARTRHRYGQISEFQPDSRRGL